DVYPSQFAPGSTPLSNQSQLLSNTGTVSGGTFTLTVGAQVTAAIPWNATANQVETALAALSTVGAGKVKCAFAPSGSATPDTNLPQTSPRGIQVFFAPSITPGAITAQNGGLTGSTPAEIVTNNGTTAAGNFNMAY